MPPTSRSSSPRSVLGVANVVKADGGKLVLIGPNPRVLSIFEITALDKYFTIVATEQEAMTG